MSKEKEWFLIFQNEHLGPYDEPMLHALYNDGEISKDSLIWKEGLDEGQSYDSLFLKPIIDEETPPAIPVDAIEESPPPFIPLAQVTSEEREEESSPPPLPDFDKEENTAKDQQKAKKWPWKSVAASLLIIIFFGLQYLRKVESDFARPAGMSLSEYQRLLKTANSDENKELFAFSLSKDKKTIWISTNIDLRGEVHFNFSNKNQENLGNSDVEIQGRALLFNNLIQISNFEFKQGTNFIDGFYNVDLFTTDELELPLLKRFFSDVEKQFVYNGTVLISSLKKESFDKVLAQKNEARGQNESEFFETLIEEYRTVQTITSQILVGLKSVFADGNSNRDEELTKFEKNYKQNYGVFFTSFVISIDKKYEVINEKDFENKTQVIAHYAKLKKLAIAVGGESINQINQLNEINLTEVKPTELKEIEFRSTLKFNEIIAECDKMIKELQDGFK